MADTPAATTPAKKTVRKPAAAKTAKPKAAAKTPAKPAPEKRTTPVAAAPARSPIRTQMRATGDTLRSEAARKAGEIGDEVGKLYQQASEQAASAARRGKGKAAEGLESLAKVIEDSARTVDDRLGSQYGDFARSAASTVANLASTLDQKDLDELLASTRDFVKKSPAVAIGSAAVVGFMLARLLRGKTS